MLRGRSRDRAERDAATVEMVYAAVTGALLATVGFLVLASPVLAGAAHGEARKGWFTGAVIVAAAAFCGRVAWTLRRFERESRGRERELELTPGRQGSPGEPGLPDGSPDRPGAPRVPRQRRTSPEDDGGPPPDQPSQPGCTSPDS